MTNSFLGVVVNGAALFGATLSSGRYLRSRSTKFCVRGHVMGLGFVFSLAVGECGSLIQLGALS